MLRDGDVPCVGGDDAHIKMIFHICDMSYPLNINIRGNLSELCVIFTTVYHCLKFRIVQTAMA